MNGGLMNKPAFLLNGKKERNLFLVEEMFWCSSFIKETLSSND